MTARLVYEAVLIEMNKVDAPSLLLEDFNYLFNKAINLYINKRYNIYDTNQQTTDDLRVLKSTAILKPTKVISTSGDDVFYGGNAISADTVNAINSLYGATYEVNLPFDYLHILNCICIFEAKARVKCYDKGNYYPFAAKRLTSDAWPVVVNNWYQRPSYKNPYYFIHNINTNIDDALPTNPYKEGTSNNGLGTGTDRNVLSLEPVDTEFNKIIKVIGPVVKNAVNSKVTSKDSEGYFLYNGTSRLFVGVLNAGTATLEVKFLWVNPSDVPEIVAKNCIKWYDVSTEYTSDSYASMSGWSTSSGYALANATSIVLRPVRDAIDLIRVDNLSKEINIGSSTVSLVEKEAAFRYGNASPVRLEIRYGKDASVFELAMVHVDYIKTPQYIRLTPELLDLTLDTSLVMEYPDYVCQEIINELVHIVMENSSDPRLQTHVPVSQSVALPAQQLTAQPSA